MEPLTTVPQNLRLGGQTSGFLASTSLFFPPSPSPLSLGGYAPAHPPHPPPPPFPRPDPVMWSKDGAELPDLDRMVVEGRELTITSLNKTDNGTYRCEASNHLGVSRAEYVLYVYGKVSLPGREAERKAS